MSDFEERDRARMLQMALNCQAKNRAMDKLAERRKESRPKKPRKK